MPLVAIISGEDTSRETITAAFNFAQAIRKQPITCQEVPGFVVNRILNSAAGEVWRQHQAALASSSAIGRPRSVATRYCCANSAVRR